MASSALTGAVGCLYIYDRCSSRVGVAQLAEHWIVAPVVVGSNPIAHPPKSHPYTRALFAASLPSHPDEAREEIVLTGEVPSALNPPSGCHFHPRCPFAMPPCAAAEPALVEVARGHRVACHLYGPSTLASV